MAEVLFQPETHSSFVTSIDGLTAKEYIVIAICSLILGLIYVSSVFLYLHVKRHKSRNSNAGNGASSSPKSELNSTNDQVTFGNGNYSRPSQSLNGGNGSVRGGGGASSLGTNSLSNRNILLNGSSCGEMGVIKNNPLLKHYPNLNDNSGFISDMSHSNSNSECDDEREITKNVIHFIIFIFHIIFLQQARYFIVILC